MSGKGLEKELAPYVSNEWRTFKDILFAFNGERALPAPQARVQRAMDRLARRGVVEKREAKTRFKCLADDMRRYRLKRESKRP